MAKAIVRINAFLNEKQTKDVYNLIYDQVKAGLEVITVPSYCDVYVLNGEDIEVQKDEKIHSSEKKGCASCKYKYKPQFDQPCVNCYYNGININGSDKWEAKDNG